MPSKIMFLEKLRVVDGNKIKPLLALLSFSLSTSHNVCKHLEQKGIIS